MWYKNDELIIKKSLYIGIWSFNRWRQQLDTEDDLWNVYKFWIVMVSVYNK